MKRARPPRQDLNLAPIMNVVVILIPMLLLAVVFLSVGVIDVSAPTLADPTQEQTSDESLDLTVAVTRSGFRISAAEKPPKFVELARKDVDLDTVFRRILRAGDSAERERAMEDALGAYDYASLYTELVRIKKAHPHETAISLAADPDVPYAVLVRVMDAARVQLEKEVYADTQAFWSARESSRGQRLFDRPILAIAR